MKKRFGLAVLLFLVIVTVLAACAGKNDGGEVTVDVVGKTYLFDKVECDDGEKQCQYTQAYDGVRLVFTDDTNGKIVNGENEKEFTYSVVHYATKEVGIQLSGLSFFEIDGCSMPTSLDYNADGNISAEFNVNGTVFTYYFNKI